jgi:hypothetical protein
VFVVALAELHSSLDAEASALAADLNVTAYEARLTLAQGMPAVVMTTADEGRALDVLARVRARGHGAVAFDTSAVVSAGAMISMRRFRLSESAILLDDRPDVLPYDDVGAIIAAVHREQTTLATETRDKTISMGRAVLTGGLVLTKTVTRETRTETSQRDPVLYVFRRSGDTPWLLRERGTMWTGHGAAISPMATANFKITVDKIRERAPWAVYDERLTTRRGGPERLTSTGGSSNTTTKSSVAGIDLFAHVIATWANDRRG